MQSFEIAFCRTCIHSGLDNSFIVSSQSVHGFQLHNLCYVRYAYTMNLFEERVLFSLWTCCCCFFSLICIFVSENSWLLPFFTRLMICSGEIERDSFYFVGISQTGVRLWSYSNTRTQGFNCVGKSRLHRNPNINAFSENAELVSMY